jgi:hypothetical protein
VLRSDPGAVLCHGRTCIYSRECLALEVDTSLPGARVVAILERLADLRGLPRSNTVDHGPEFEGQALDAWAYKRCGLRLFVTASLWKTLTSRASTGAFAMNA